MRPRSSSAPSPSRSASPGRRLWTNTSARSTSRRTASRPRSSASDTASERLPAFTARNIALSPFQNGGPHARPSSPVSGRSTFTTSAPRAPRISAQYGPAIEVVTSTTRIPVERAKRHRAIIAPAARMRRMPDWLDFDQLHRVGLRRSGGATSSSSPSRPSTRSSRSSRARRRSSSAATFAARATSNLLLVILAGAAGAIVGDNISFWHRPLRRGEDREAWSSAARSRRSGSSGRSARSTSAARTSSSSPVHPRRAHGRHVLGRLRERRSRGDGSSSTTSSQVSSGRRTAALLGYFGGKTFEENPLWGVLLALGIALSLGFVVEAVRHFRQRRAKPSA